MAAVALLRIISPVEIPTGLGYAEAIREGGRKSKFSISKRDAIQRKKCWWRLHSLYSDSTSACVGFEPESSNNGSFLIMSSLVANHAGEGAVSSEQKVYDVVLKQAALVADQKARRSTMPVDVRPDMVAPGTLYLLKEAYERCGEVCEEYAKTFYLG